MIDSLYELLKSIGFDEPLHSPITHMPIGLTVGALVFLVVALVFKKTVLVPSARHAAILAFIFVFPTILLGVLDWIHFYHGALMPAIIVKMVLAGVVTLSLGAVIILGSEIKLHGLWMTSLLAVAFIGVMGLGWFGAGIIYGRGTEVAQSTPTISGSSAETATTAVSQKGRQIFAANCQSCHANGGNVINAKLPLKGSPRLADLGSFSAFVRAPSNRDGSPGEMPAFGEDRLDEASLAELYSYVSGTWK